MRVIDGDALMELLTTAIRNMRGVAKFIGAEDDPEIKMEIKAYTDIANGVKDMPTIEPERKTGRWIKVNGKTAINCSACYHCSWSLSFEDTVKRFKFCPNCGAMMEEGDHT